MKFAGQFSAELGSDYVKGLRKGNPINLPQSGDIPSRLTGQVTDTTMKDPGCGSQTFRATVDGFSDTDPCRLMFLQPANSPLTTVQLYHP